MKYCMIIISVLLLSCANQTNSTPSESELKEQKLKILADSTVSLSFSGIVLGQPLKQTVDRAIKDNKIWDVKFKVGKATTCKANIYLPEKENPIPVDMGIYSFQDTITSIMITSEDFETHQELIKLYRTKYNMDYASFEDDADYWGENIYRSGSSSDIWTFKNQTLRVSNFYTEKRENYIKDARMRSPENRYGIKYTKFFKAIVILYNDIYHCEKVEKYEAELRAKEYKKKLIEKEDQDKHIKQLQDRAIQQDI